MRRALTGIASVLLAVAALYGLSLYFSSRHMSTRYPCPVCGAKSVRRTMDGGDERYNVTGPDGTVVAAILTCSKDLEHAWLQPLRPDIYGPYSLRLLRCPTPGCGRYANRRGVDLLGRRVLACPEAPAGATQTHGHHIWTDWRYLDARLSAAAVLADR